MPKTLTHNVWMYRDPTLATSLSKQEIVGFDVESIDGSIGKSTTRHSKRTLDTSSSTPGRGSSARRSCFRWACSERRPRERDGLRQSYEG